MSEREIFDQALGLTDPKERASFLDDACGTDAAQRKRLEEMLDAQKKLGSFLETPAVPQGPTIVQIPSEGPGTQIGPYKLLQQIGEGGMGVVFMAEQHQPVKRLVALKIIKTGMDSKQVIARFEAERQALSMMDHPNIARVLDAGTTDSGRPYFVMELVKGQPITQYCDEHHLTPRQRLELLLPVCQAIQHAHQKGIIHRDVKPSNLLVAEYDHLPVPKVIDFGVAKAINQPLTDKTMFTGLGHVVGTLEYMSPEQAKVNQLDIDTRSDIYSLGVLLYELLTGTTPFDKKRLQNAAWDEMLRIIREEDPPKPSTRLSDSIDSLPSISSLRHTEPAKLTRMVRGELDWIVMKALDKDRNRRYETANGFAMDLQRYLADEAVQACPPSAGYRFKKFARRNRRKLVAAGVLATAILVAFSGIGWAVRDRTARRVEAERERNERLVRVTAQVELNLVDVDRLMKDQKWDDALAVAKRAEAALAGGEADDVTREKVVGVVRNLEFVARLAAIRYDRSESIDGKVDHAKSVKEYERAFRDYGVDLVSLPMDTAVNRFVAFSGIELPLASALDDCCESWRASLGLEQPGWKTLVEAARRLDADPVRNRLRTFLVKNEIVQDREELLSLAKSADILRHGTLTITLLSKTLRRAGLFENSEAILRAAQRRNPGDFWVNYSLALSLSQQKKYDEMARFATAAIAIRPSASVAHTLLGNALHGVGKLEEAIDSHRKAMEIAPKSFDAHNNLGAVLQDQGKLDEAITFHLKAIELDPKKATAQHNLGLALMNQKKLDEAISCYRKAIELDPKYAAPQSNLGIALVRQEKVDESIAYYRKAIELEPKNAGFHSNLGDALYRQGKVEEPSPAIVRLSSLIRNSPLRTTTLAEPCETRTRPWPLIARPSNLIRNMPQPTATLE